MREIFTIEAMNTSKYNGAGETSDRDNSVDEVFSVPVKAGKRIYYFDVKATRGNEYYITITESRKRLNRDGRFTIDKHKLHIYKEDFAKFREGLDQVLGFIGEQQPDTWHKPEKFETFAAIPVPSASAPLMAAMDNENILVDDLTPYIPTEEEFFKDLDFA